MTFFNKRTALTNENKIIFINLYKEYSYLKSNELEEFPCFWVIAWQPS